jgi:hypothetical protein
MVTKCFPQTQETSKYGKGLVIVMSTLPISCVILT